MMRYYPVFLDIRGKRCAVVGGGKVAERKVFGLLKAGAEVCVISPELTRRLKKLADTGKIKHIGRAYKKDGIMGASLAIAASDSKDVNAAVFRDAQARRIPVNTVDDPAGCSFIVPSIVDRGDLIIAISTSGVAPAFAKRLREAFENGMGREYEVFTRIIGEARNNLLKTGAKRAKKERVINALMDSPLLALIRKNQHARVDALLKNLLGEGFSLSELGINLSKPLKKPAGKG